MVRDKVMKKLKKVLIIISTVLFCLGVLYFSVYYGYIQWRIDKSIDNKADILKITEQLLQDKRFSKAGSYDLRLKKDKINVDFEPYDEDPDSPEHIETTIIEDEKLLEIFYSDWFSKKGYIHIFITEKDEIFDQFKSVDYYQNLLLTRDSFCLSYGEEYYDESSSFSSKQYLGDKLHYSVY